MAGEDLLGQDRRGAIGDMLGLMMHQAVAEGAVGMVKTTRPGTPEHSRWTEVASKAVPLYGEFLDGVKGRHPNMVTEETEETPDPSIAVTDSAERQQKQERLLQLEAEAERLRQELGRAS